MALYSTQYMLPSAKDGYFEILQNTRFSAPPWRRQHEWPKHLGNTWCVCLGGVDTICGSHQLHCNNLKTPYKLEPL
jgi:hypothetical protein